MAKREYVKWDIDKVREFVEENSDCILISREYTRMKNDIEFKCFCGNHFKKQFQHFKASKRARMCQECSASKRGLLRRNTYDEVYNYIKENGEGCRLVSKTYEGNDKPLKLKCVCGSTFKNTFKNLQLRKRFKCYECQPNLRTEWNYDSVKYFIEVESESGCKLLSDNYSEMGDVLEFQCECSNRFECKFEKFAFRNQRQCSICSKATSKGEGLILRYLQTLNIKSEAEYMYDDLIGIGRCPLKFDFAVLDENNNTMLLIEADGVQHFEPVKFFGGEDRFKKQQYHDQLKNDYCKQNNIPLLRIPYWDFDNIESILNKELNKYGLLNYAQQLSV